MRLGWGEERSRAPYAVSHMTISRVRPAIVGVPVLRPALPIFVPAGQDRVQAMPPPRLSGRPFDAAAA
jgi:hypothetical protein